MSPFARPNKPDLLLCETCAGCGEVCDYCGAAEKECECSDDDRTLEDCDDCAGAGRVCEECGEPDTDCTCAVAA